MSCWGRLLVLMGGLVAVPAVPGAQGQAVLQASAQAAQAMTDMAVVLRPEPELRTLAEQVAKVLGLRSDRPVTVGNPPPPGLLEAVPQGHVALAVRVGEVVLVAGSSDGASLESHVKLSADGTVDPRAVALAVEVIRDSAIDEAAARAARTAPAVVAPSTPRTQLAARGPAAEAPAGTGAAAAPERPLRSATGSHAPIVIRGGDGPDDGAPFGRAPFLEAIEPFAFIRSYSGVSSSSRSLEAGLATGAGLCAARQCLVVVSEVPVTSAATQDLRYRYLTLSALFYSRPVRWGAFTAGGSLGFLSRIGRFEADMGLPDRGLDTDLGVRGSLEVAFAAMDHVDVMAETGVDVALDRLRRTSGGKTIQRGQRLSPWLQLALRLRTRAE